LFTELHLDIETYSSISIKKAGSYRYFESFDFEILMLAYAFDQQPVKMVDFMAGEEIPAEVIEAFENPEIKKCAHNANFERNAFKKIGHDIPIDQWECSMVKAAYCGLPLPLGTLCKALKLSEAKQKLSSGKALIRYFCEPCKPTKTNGKRHRNLPQHDPEKWEDFKEYCIHDVEAEREAMRLLSVYDLPKQEQLYYMADQIINDRGVKIDLDMAKMAVEVEEKDSEIVLQKIEDLTGIDNPNSSAQLREWLSKAMQKEVKSIAKAEISKLLNETESDAVRKVLNLRKKSSKTSVKKYSKMLDMVCEDGRAHGLFQFYGANRTGRWAGRGVQLQNLRRNDIPDLKLIRDILKTGDFELLKMLFENVADILSQLIRTAFIAEPGYTLAAADFSAIEARVIAWLADETWRLDVFNGHGKIYEASAAMMFGVPIEQITKGSDLRQRGKVAELALGFQGGAGALSNMEGQLKIPESERLSIDEKEAIKNKWRAASPNIQQMWYDFDTAAKKAVRYKRKFKTKYKGIEFDYDGVFLKIKLCSGRKLFYYKPRFYRNKFNQPAIKYQGYEQGRWTYVGTYGGKLTENIVQATARDLLAQSMLKVIKKYDVIMHVHDELVCEVPKDAAEQQLRDICSIMAEPVDWAEGLPLDVDGYTTEFYKKD
jgi:DNA polymerase